MKKKVYRAGQPTKTLKARATELQLHSSCTFYIPTYNLPPPPPTAMGRMYLDTSSLHPLPSLLLHNHWSSFCYVSPDCHLCQDLLVKGGPGWSIHACSYEYTEQAMSTNTWHVQCVDSLLVQPVRGASCIGTDGALGAAYDYTVLVQVTQVEKESPSMGTYYDVQDLSASIWGRVY